ncbi:hypothetical protein HYH03_010494 [Edaphochlamys debaryana]|uniref:EamA domain-containing protein n=1 Tax=Edaphochlamys debaryana TaxID=47281 RepID=A0A835XXX2_9CHLO|nr:hypothetical protein HYH03_010494 [Edaphochlamys debaryana]|eukprot:KAG2491048.1 hypothetical protein HYH03_010494 [Edaphochlamys debaryana]
MPPSSRGLARDLDLDGGGPHVGHSGLHHLHGGGRGERGGGGSLALELPPSRGPPVLRPGRAASRRHLFGALCLLAVAGLWGSYSPVLKFLFTQPQPPSAALMTAAQALLAALFLLGSGAAEAAARTLGASAPAPAPPPRLGPWLGAGVGFTTLLGCWQPVARALGRRRHRREPLFPPRPPLQSVPVHAGHGPNPPHPYAPPPHHGHHAHGPGGGDLLAHSRSAPHVGAVGGLGGGEGGLVALPGFGGPASAGGSGPPSDLSSASSGGGSVGGGASVPLQGAGRGALLPSVGSGGSGPGWAGRNVLARPLPSLAAAGLELGAYNFFAVALGTWGVQLLSATKVAFLGQATSLMTPFLVALSGQRVAAAVWAACAAGAMGGALVALDGSSGGHAAAAVSAAAAAAASGAGGVVPAAPPAGALAGEHGGGSRAMRLETGGAGAGAGAAGAGAGAALAGSMLHAGLPPALSQESMGANYVLASCVFYALGTVRMGVHSGRFGPLELAAASALAYAGLSAVWLGAEVLGTPSGGRADADEVWRLLGDPVALVLVLWAGFGPGALSSYLQVMGQKIVPAAQAQMLYSSTPLWSALLARLLLRGSDGAMGRLAWLGGGIMLGASLGASLAEAALAGRGGGGGTAGGGGGTGSGAGTGSGERGGSASGGKGDRSSSSGVGFGLGLGGAEGEKEEAERDL